MARLIIITGASGAGKSFLIKQLQSFMGKIEIIKKRTDRKNAKGALDLITNCSVEQIRGCDYTYRYFGDNYGIIKNDINSALADDFSPIVIVSDGSTVSKMKADYKTAFVVYIQNILSGEDLAKQLVKFGDRLNIEDRLRRHEYTLQVFAKWMGNNLFEYFLINNFDENFFLSQAQDVFTNNVINGVDYNYVFVIMTFDSKYNEIYKAIKSASRVIANKNIRIQRIDEKLGGYEITKAIEESINKAGLVICDLSEFKPNVCYELGYAKAKGKDIIIIANEEIKGTLPFDISHYRTIFYNSAFELQEKLILEFKEHYVID